MRKLSKAGFLEAAFAVNTGVVTVASALAGGDVHVVVCDNIAGC